MAVGGWKIGNKRKNRAETKVGAALRLAVKFFVGDAEVVEDAAVDDGFFDDAGNVGKLHAAVPDGLGIDHDGGAELTLVQAAGGVGADEWFEAAALDFFFERTLEGFAAVGV